MATSNRIRALNRLPFDFQDGLKVGGVDVTNLNQAFTPAGAGLIGFTPVGGISATNVQAALAELDNEKVAKDALAASTGVFGASLVGYDGGSIQVSLDKAKPISDYAALRAYTGTATQIRITTSGTSGFFYYDSTDTTSLDNAGTIIVSSNGKRWKRLYEGAVNVKWFGAKGDDTDDTVAIQAADDYCNSENATLWFPKGSYSFGIVNARASWDGDGQIKAQRINVNSPKRTFRNLTFVSQGLTLFSVGTLASPRPSFENIKISFLSSLGGARKAIYVQDCVGLKVTGCYIETGGLELINAADFTITNNHLDRQWITNTVEGIHASKKSYGIIQGNTILNSTIDAVDLYSSGERTIVTGNRFIGFTDCSAIEAKVIIRDDGVSSGDPGYGYTESVIISNNILKDFSYTKNSEIAGIYAEYIDERVTPTYPLDRSNAGVIITSNIIENAYVTNNPALSVQFSAIGYGGSNALISNNVFRNIYSNNSAGGVFAYAITLGENTLSVKKTLKGISIIGNMISTDSGGIRFGRTTAPVDFYDIVINNNSFKNDYRTGQSVQRCIAVEAGASIYNSIFNSNIFETDNATRRGAFFFSATNPIFTKNVVSNNQFIGSSANFKTASYCNITNNFFDCLGYSQTPLTIGVTGTDSNGNTVINNKFKQADTALGAIDVYQQVGFGISHNVFQDATMPIRVYSTSTSGLITENISISGGATFVTYSGSSPVTEANNLIV